MDNLLCKKQYKLHDFKEINILGVASLREGFFSRRSNLTTIATSMRFRIASYLASDSYRMTTALLEPVNGSVVEGSIKDAETSSA
jgi:hypothetical protein